MAATIGAILGALLRQFLLSRLALFALTKMGDTARRIYLAHAITYVVATLACAYGFAKGGPPQFLHEALANLLPSLVWLVVDVLRMMRRRAKIRDAVYISRMR